MMVSMGTDAGCWNGVAYGKYVYPSQGVQIVGLCRMKDIRRCRSNFRTTNGQATAFGSEGNAIEY